MPSSLTLLGCLDQNPYPNAIDFVSTKKRSRSVIIPLQTIHDGGHRHPRSGCKLTLFRSAQPECTPVHVQDQVNQVCEITGMQFYKNRTCRFGADEHNKKARCVHGPCQKQAVITSPNMNCHSSVGECQAGDVVSKPIMQTLLIIQITDLFHAIGHIVMHWRRTHRTQTALISQSRPSEDWQSCQVQILISALARQSLNLKMEPIF